MQKITLENLHQYILLNASEEQEIVNKLAIRRDDDLLAALIGNIKDVEKSYKEGYEEGYKEGYEEGLEDAQW